MQQNKLDLTIFPEQIKIELIDYYEFLKEKYIRKGKLHKNIDIKLFVPRKVPAFSPLEREAANER